ncbi:DNA polymerase IV [Brachybacterium sp. AOP25-B2-12]|uniref:DNA polymerase IV n=1 Tax=Brachybacterium sp. AOP25-B2-12 TaxID=3457710 RepID=UPI004033878D
MSGADSTILHLDMDSFFASVEIRDDPELRGLPVVVGGTGRRSVVAAASYPARTFGIRSAMPMEAARRRCPDLVIVPPHMERYRAASRDVMAVLSSVCADIEQISIDEAFLDVRGARRQFGSAEQIATILRGRIRDELDLPSSVGGSVSRTVAKIASARAKPDGQLIVPADQTAPFLAPLDVRAIPGIGPAAASSLERLGVTRIGQLVDLPVTTLRRAVGPSAPRILHVARGEDRTGLVHQVRDRSLGTEHTYEEDISDPAEVRRRLTAMADDVAADLRAHGFTTRTVAVKLRAPDGTTITRSATFAQATDSGERLREHVVALWERVAPQLPRIRLAGVRAEQLRGAEDGAAPSELTGRTAGWQDLERAMDRARARFGGVTLARGSTLPPRGEDGPRTRGPGTADDARTGHAGTADGARTGATRGGGGRTAGGGRDRSL